MKKSPLHLRLPASLAVIVALATFGSVASQAQSTFTYSTTSTQNAWNNSANWTGGPSGYAPGVSSNTSALINHNSGDIAIFTNVGFTTTSGALAILMTNNSASTGVGSATDASGWFSLGAIESTMTSFPTHTQLGIGNGSGSCGGILQLNGATLNPGPGPMNNVLIALSDSTTLGMEIQNAGAGAGGATMLLWLGNANGIFYVTTNQTLTIDVPMYQVNSGTGFTKNGAGTLSISASPGLNYCTGTITVNAGTYNVGVAQTGGASDPVILNGGVLAFGTSTVGISSVAVDGNAAISVTGSGRSYSFPVALNGGLTLTGTSSTATTTYSGPWTIGGGPQTITTLVADSTISGAIGDGGNALGLIKAGSTNRLFLSAANTYTGPTTISAGGLVLNSGGSLSSSTISIAGGATNDVSAKATGYTLLSSSQTLAGTGTTSSGTVVLPSGGATLGSGSLALTYGGTVPTLTINGGQLNLNNAPVTVTVSGGALLGSSGGTTYQLVAAGTGLVGGSVASSTLTIAGSGIVGTGSLSISGGSLYLTVTSAVTATQVQVETAPDGSGSVVSSQNIPAGSSITGYSIARSANGTFVANSAATWSLTGVSGGVVSGDLVPAGNGASATFTGHLVGSASIQAVSTGLTPGSSGTLTVVAGSAAVVRVETAADGSGGIVPAQTVNSGSSVTGYAIERDAQGNFVGNVAASSWSLVNVTGGVVQSDLVPAGGSLSAVFTVHAAGTAAIQATAAGVTSTASGTLTALGKSITWVGDGSANSWDFVTTNWSGGQMFDQGDIVLFNDTGSESPAVSIATSVAPASLTVNATGNYTFSGIGGINGSGALTNSGTGMLTLLTTNGYTGGTWISAGSVSVQSSSGLGAGSVVVAANSEVQVQGGIAMTNALTLNGAGLANDGSLHSISGTNTWAGSLTLKSASRINADAGALTIISPSAITGSGFGLSVGGAGSVVISNAIATGAGTLTKDGAGQLLLGGTNSFSGAVTVNAGTLATTNGFGFGLGSITLNNNTGISLTPSTTLSITVTNPITVAAGATATLDTGSMANSLGGPISSGDTTSILTVSNKVPLGINNTSQLANFQGTINVLPNATLRWSAEYSGVTYGSASASFVVNGTMEPRNNGNTVLLGTLSGSGKITGNAANAGAGPTTYEIGGGNVNSTFSGIITDGSSAVPTQTIVQKVGTATLILSGSNSYGGGTVISNGTLDVSSTGSIQSNVTVIAGNLQLDNAAALSSAAALTLASSPAAGAVYLNFSGAQTISALNFGPTSMAAGTWGAVGSTANNQSAAFTGSGILNVTSGGTAQTITFSNPGTQTYGVAPITLVGSASSGLTISYAVTSGPATVAGNTLTVTGAGSVTVQASQTGYGTQYNPAPAVSQTFLVNNASLSITANAQSKTYGQTVVFGGGSTAFASSGLQNNETIGTVTLACSGGASNAPVAGSPYTITPSAATGGTFAAGNYSITYNTNTLTVSPLAVVLTGAEMYDGTTNVTNSILSVANVVGSDDVSVASGSASMASADIGTNTITSVTNLVLGGNTAPNYTLAGASGAVIVTPLAVVLTGTRPVRDGTTTAASTILSVSNAVGSDDVSVASGGAVLAGSAAGVEAISDPSGLVLGGTTASNYSLTSASGSVLVTTVPLSITANPVSKTYGTVLTLDPTAFAVTGTLVGSEQVTAVTMTANGGTAATDPVSGSPYTITPSAATGIDGFLAANYNIAYNTGSLSVNPLPVILTGTRPYDGTATAASTILTVANAVGSDDVSAASGSAVLANASVGVQPITDPSGLTLGGVTAGNYTLTGASGSVTITNPFSAFNITSSSLDATRTNLVVCWQSVPGVVYNVLTNANPSGAWAVASGPITATNTSTCFTLPGGVTGNTHVFVVIKQ